MRIRYGVVAASLLLSVASTQSFADPCFPGPSPFPDISSTDSFCTEVEWIKNRGVTLGCLGGNYCPGDVVTRASMALFMKRLGTALTPEIVVADLNTGALDLDVNRLTPAANTCKTAPYTVAGYPRQALIAAQWSGYTAGPAQAFAIPTFSVDSGTTFTDISANGMRSSASGAAWLTMSQTAKLDLAVGTTYVFAFAVQRANEDLGGNDVTQSRCNITVSITSRDGTTSPYDAAPAGIHDDNL